MQIPRKYIEDYSKALNVVSEQARQKLVDALAQIDYSADIADIRNAVIVVMQVACNASTQVSARLAAEFYDGLRKQFILDTYYAASAVSLREPEATSEAIRAFVQVLVDEKPVDEFIKLCADRMDYETRRAANECVAENAKLDPAKPKWARVPTRTEAEYKPWSEEPGVTHNKQLAEYGTCPFCLMLASRGFAYQSDETASHAHSGCDCRVVPSWDKSNPIVQGYDPDKYYDQWIATGFRPSSRKSGGGSKKANKDLGMSGNFRETGIKGMNDYLRSSKDLDELYKRADEVLQDIKQNWGGDRNMFVSASRTAKEMRNKLS